MTTYADVRPEQRTPFARYRHSLWLLTQRDLRVRYSTSLLGYFWSILDPLVMAGIYWFVFTQIFHREVGEDPYIIFLLTALLPWMWFNGAISDSTRAFLIYHAPLNINAIFFPLAIILQTVLTAGVGLIVAPLVVFFRDLERAVKLVLRFLFYASPIIYATSNLPPELHFWAAFNPLSGIFGLYRSAFFPEQLDWFTVGVGAVVSVAILLVGIFVFTRTERAVLKEI